MAAVSSDSDDSGSSGADDPNLRTDLEESILSAYLQISGRSSSPDLSKIRSFLSSSTSSSSFVACLICLERIRYSDPIWSCSAGCHAAFHLPCIQGWAHQCSHRSPEWHCPKCRLTYPLSLTPRSYRCFCGKLEDPPPDPWKLPHTCGDPCGRALRPACGHDCLLLCHPGPCPPCPKFVPSRCFCGSNRDVRRCALKNFSCASPCPKPLPCGDHRCPDRCHDAPCHPCAVKGRHRCACQKVEEERPCSEREFRCDIPCSGMLGCGKHRCGRGCHSGACGDCPLQGRRTCPCGKKEHRGVSCDADVPTCGSTCEKVLSCGVHRCPERCHNGMCAATCRMVSVKSCRCGSLKKEVPCYQDLVCERKCQHVRDCGRHACKRRCCNGDCPPCPEICGKKLRCNNHKCPAPCHRGACAPCPLTVSISCACGETHFEVPCGTENNQKPPRCSKPCQISRLCIHKSECRPHKCHYGPCSTCRMICGDKLSCGHNCKQRCHGPRPPANPEFTLKPRKKRVNKQMEHTAGSPCAPCTEVIWMSCFGQHIGEERQMLCSSKRLFSCQNLCGNLLHCGNHYCTKPCHVLKNRPIQLGKHEMYEDTKVILPPDAENRLAESCEKCSLPCQKVRDVACSHPCPRPCHSDNCPPCEVLIKRSCHCGSMVHAFKCAYYNSLSEKEQLTIRSCSGPCHRKLPNCPHLCSEICHPSQCPSINNCSKKVTVRCLCNNLKRVWLCQEVLTVYRNGGRDPRDIAKNQFGVGLLSCNEDCTDKVKVVDPELQLRKTKVTKSTVDAVNVPKRRKRRERFQEATQISRFQVIKTTMLRFLLFIFVSLLIIVCVHYGYKGLFWISDWMNEIEERRSRSRYPKI